MRNAVLYLLLFSLPFFAHAQLPYPWEIGGGIGVGAYQGDLHTTKTNLQFYTVNPSISAHLRRNVSNNFAARAGLLYTRLSADDNDFDDPEYHRIRGISFKTSLVELSLNGELYPFGLYKKSGGDAGGLSNTRRMVAPYATIGIGGAYYNAKVDWNDANGNEAINATAAQVDKDYPKKFSLSIPFGAGIRFTVNDELTLGLEGAVRYTPTDYLDGFSVAGNPEANDWFYTAQIVASYAFGVPAQPSRDRISSPASNAGNKSSGTDTDGDGLNDDQDDCPDVTGLRSLKGCPDTDRDGIADKNDLCPENAGLATLSGCPDRDADGIADKDDNCPDLKGVLAYRGCPAIDRDKDGVADAEDLCPDMSGQLRWKGCPDSDSDGLPDNKDACPGIAGPEALRGCPDTDEDGIADKDDECPTVAGIAAKKGCPDPQAPAPGVPFKAVYFGSTELDWYSTSVTTLNEVVTILNADPSLFARIEGHTDNTGEEPANALLSENRAKKCQDYLISQGIDAKRLNYLGFGSQRPSTPNTTLQNKQLNRRVEVHFYKK